MIIGRTVCFIMPSISKSAEDPWQIVTRCDRLTAKFLTNEKAGSATAILLSSGFSEASQSNRILSSGLKVHLFGSKKVNPIIFVVKAYRALKPHRNNQITLIAGDNYLALMMCVVLKLSIGSQVKIQISIHGNPLSHGGSAIRLLVRRLAYIFLVPKASSIRLVSGHLGKELERYIPEKANVFISPIPITMTENFDSGNEKLKIGFIGRLHYERGVELFCEILDYLAKQNNHFEFSIIGEGPELDLLHNFCAAHPDFAMEILGSLPHSEVLSIFRFMKILISCAPNEGYGLALREAITSGTFVVALSNEGTRELQKLFPEMVFLFESVEEAAQVVRSLVGLSPEVEVVKKYRQIQTDLDENAMDLLVNSWR